MGADKLKQAPVATSGPAKLKEVTTLLKQLQDDLEKKTLLPHQRQSALEKLKVHSRNLQDADPLYSQDGVRTLLRHSFDSNSQSISREALRCLANVLLLKPEARPALLEHGYVDKAVERYKSENTNDEFLLGRILFLMTYNTSLDYEKQVNENSLGDTINSHISRHLKRASKRRSVGGSHEMDDMALGETSKLLYNISYFYPDLHVVFSKSIQPMFKILCNFKIPPKPMKAPINNIINVLQNLDPEDAKEPRYSQLNAKKDTYPKLSNSQAEHLIQILDSSITSYPEEEIERTVAPLLGLIRRVYDVSSDSVRKYMEWLLLPKDEERNRPLGTADTLSAHLLRLLGNPALQNFRSHLNDMFFELSQCDASKLSTNLGFGFASGILNSKGVGIPQTAEEAYSTAGQEGTNDPLNPAPAGGEPVNPITGQKRSTEPEDTSTPMTQEEKEREAERLFVLFERLKATGVMNVMNPVEEAIQTGRFEELPD